MEYTAAADEEENVTIPCSICSDGCWVCRSMLLVGGDLVGDVGGGGRGRRGARTPGEYGKLSVILYVNALNRSSHNGDQFT